MNKLFEINVYQKERLFKRIPLRIIFYSDCLIINGSTKQEKKLNDNKCIKYNQILNMLYEPKPVNESGEFNMTVDGMYMIKTQNKQYVFFHKYERGDQIERMLSQFFVDKLKFNYKIVQ